MDDDALGAALTHVPPNVSTRAEIMARALADEIVRRELGPTASLRSRWNRPRVVLPVGAAALALTGAGTLAAYELSIPPFQTLESGVQRTAHPVPIDYRMTTGQQVSCDAFVEMRAANHTQRQQIETMITSTDWTGYGQRTYAALPASGQAVTTAPGPVGEVVLADLKKRANAAAPGVEITGGAISCTYGSRRDAKR